MRQNYMFNTFKVCLYILCVFLNCFKSLESVPLCLCKISLFRVMNTMVIDMKAFRVRFPSNSGLRIMRYISMK